MTKKNKKSEESILFPEAKVGDITIKPWSFGTLFEISPLLEIVLDKVEDKNIDFEISFFSYGTLFRLFTIASKEVLSIISITLGIKEKEISKLPMDEGIKIAGIIIKQNWEIISKNVLSLLRVPEVEEEETEKTEEKKEKTE